MNCKKPLDVFQNTRTGQVLMKRPTDGTPFVPIKLPCRLCMPCRLNYKADRTIRMVHELQEYLHSYFLTPTYSDDKIDPNYNLRHRDMTLFIKRLRKRKSEAGNKDIRYAYCGEYGAQTSRPHYHAIFYGVEINDLVFHSKNNNGDIFYTSEEINRIWGLGEVLISEANETTCGYVASYMQKDATGDYTKVDEKGKPKPYYMDTLDRETGEVKRVERERPFMRFSTSGPYRGLGYRWYQKNKRKIARDGYITVPKGVRTTQVGGLVSRKAMSSKQRIPDYYMSLMENDPEPEIREAYKKIRAQRKEIQTDEDFRHEQTPQRQHAKEVNRIAKTRLRRRGSEKAKQQHVVTVTTDGELLTKAPEKPLRPDPLSLIDRKR